MKKQTIYELKIEQQRALDALEWVDSEAEAEEVKKILNSIEGDVKRKLAFWITPLKEAEGEAELAKQAFKIFEEQHRVNIARKEKRAEWIREHVLSLMVDFKIDKFDCNQFKASHGLAPGTVEFCENFDIEKIPEKFITIIPEQKILNKKSVSEVLRKLIKDEKGKLSPNIQIVQTKEIPGVLLDRKQTLRVR